MYELGFITIIWFGQPIRFFFYFKFLNYNYILFLICFYSIFFLVVDGGERVVIFDRFRGVLSSVSGEGTHFLVPWVQKPVFFSIRSKPRNVPVLTGSKGWEEPAIINPASISFLYFYRPPEC